MQRSLRHKTIIRSVASGTTVSVEALCDLTGASAITIRRDLAELADQGAVRRVRGGVTRADVRGTLMPFSVRFETDRERKDALAVVAAGLVADGESLVLDNGTTCYAVARHLAGRPVTALALSLHAAAALATRPGATVIVPGGPVENDTLAFTGHAAVRAISETNADVAIIGTCSAQPGFGLTSTNYEDAQVKRACLAAGARRVLITTAEKLTRTSTFRFGEFGDLTHLVTTADADPDRLAQFRADGVEVYLVETPPPPSAGG
ncbi:DeoR/GlpR family DNA-binding transcription regulator [Nocardioides luteus]|uniref:DeoR/GlpR family DNA-binding transcription regulator n=1 Tax=Nocardioides luteus TaxID=1844 RepID=UPI0018CA0601|nr:DeoR/GlpR family DNA-binding transcription regulator [Nocardioides luteus]